MLLSIDVPRDVSQDAWVEGELPRDWRTIGAESALDRGDAWLERSAAAVLWVPSAILPEEKNGILNPRHPAHARMRIVDRRPFELDRRLLVLHRGEARR